MAALQVASATGQRRTDLIAAIAYFIAALAFLLPLPFYWATFIPGDNGDSYPNLWPFWYYPQALGSGGNLFFHRLLFYPEGIHLVFTSASTVGSILMAPVSLLISSAAALNCWLLLHLWLGGYFLFRFCRQLDCGPWAAWLGGFAFAWSPFIAVHITGHYTLTQIGYTAGALWSLAVLVRRSDSLGPGHITRRQIFQTFSFPAGALALCCWAVAVTDFYLAIMTLFLLLVALCHFGLCPGLRRGVRNRAFLLAVACAAVVCAILLIPWVFAILQARQGHDYSALERGMGSKNIAQWSRLITLPAYHSVWEPLFFQSFMGKISLFNEWTYLGMVAFLVAGVGLLYVRPWQRGAVWMVAFMVALGLGFGNRYSYERGYATSFFSLGRWWPDFFPFAQFRVPGRWQFALCTILAVGLALGSDALFYRRGAGGAGASSGRTGLKRALLAVAITAAIGFDQLRWPLPITEATPLDAGISSARSGAVLDIPVGIRSGQGHSMGQFDSATLRRQMVHGRPILSANVSRLPNNVISRLRSDPELSAFFVIQGGAAEVASDAVTSTALSWPDFRKRYEITAVRIPADWPTSASLQLMVDKMAPGDWHWRNTGQAIVGEMQ